MTNVNKRDADAIDVNSIT